MFDLQVWSLNQQFAGKWVRQTIDAWDKPVDRAVKISHFWRDVDGSILYGIHEDQVAAYWYCRDHAKPGSRCDRFEVIEERM